MVYCFRSRYNGSTGLLSELQLQHRYLPCIISLTMSVNRRHGPIIKRLKESTPPSLSTGITLLFFIPAAIYLGNPVEFAVSPEFLLASLGLIGLLASFALALVIALFRDAPRAVLVKVLAAVSLYLWIKGTFLVGQYGAITGTAIEWRKFIFQGALDILLILALAGGTIAFGRFLRNHSVILAAVILGAQALSLTYTLAFRFTRPDLGKESLRVVDRRAEFSANRNILVVLFDAFRSDVFGRIIRDSSLAGAFNGFTYFSNTTSGYPTSFPSLPLILTGEYYENRQPIYEFIQKMYADHSVISRLSDKGWRVELYEEFSHYSDPKRLANLKAATNLERGASSIGSSLRYAIFRVAPHFAKPAVYAALFTSQFESMAAADVRFIKSLSGRITSTEQRDLFRFVYLRGVHAPYVLKPDLSVDTSLPQDQTGYASQAAADVRMMTMFLDALKNAGVYDQTMIVFCADHGTPLPDDPPTTLSKSRVWPSGYYPLLLIKPFSAAGSLIESDTPASLVDIARTILSAIGEGEEFGGENLLGKDLSSERIRRVMTYQWSNENWRSAYLPVMTEYEVTGFPLREDAWRRTGYRYSAGKVEHGAWPLPEGASIKFRGGGNAALYVLDGWSLSEGEFAWTDGPQANLAFRPSRWPTHLNLVISHVFLPPQIQSQAVKVSINGVAVSTLEISRPGEYLIPMKGTTPSPDFEIGLRFDLPNAVSPKESGMSDDARKLAIALSEIQLLPATLSTPEPQSIITTISFGRGGDAEKYQQSGWSGGGDGFTWTDGTEASLVVPVPRKDGAYRVQAVIRMPFLYPGLPSQQVEILASGRQVGAWDVSTGGTYSIDLAADAIRSDGVLDLVFRIRDAASPKAHGMSEDARLLGLAFSSLTITAR
jgi:hypothetical protein